MKTTIQHFGIDFIIEYSTLGKHEVSIDTINGIDEIESVFREYLITDLIQKLEVKEHDDLVFAKEEYEERQAEDRRERRANS